MPPKRTQDSKTAASSSSSTPTVSKRRNRHAITCENCRQRKTKCDRTPNCSSCRLRGLTCTWIHATPTVLPDQHQHHHSASSPDTAAFPHPSLSASRSASMSASSDHFPHHYAAAVYGSSSTPASPSSVPVLSELKSSQDELHVLRRVVTALASSFGLTSQALCSYVLHNDPASFPSLLFHHQQQQQQQQQQQYSNPSFPASNHPSRPSSSGSQMLTGCDPSSISLTSPTIPAAASSANSSVTSLLLPQQSQQQSQQSQQSNSNSSSNTPAAVNIKVEDTFAGQRTSPHSQTQHPSQQQQQSSIAYTQYSSQPQLFAPASFPPPPHHHPHHPSALGPSYPSSPITTATTPSVIGTPTSSSTIPTHHHNIPPPLSLSRPTFDTYPQAMIPPASAPPVLSNEMTLHDQVFGRSAHHLIPTAPPSQNQDTYPPAPANIIYQQ